MKPIVFDIITAFVIQLRQENGLYNLGCEHEGSLLLDDEKRFSITREHILSQVAGYDKAVTDDDEDAIMNAHEMAEKQMQAAEKEARKFICDTLVNALANS